MNNRTHNAVIENIFDFKNADGKYKEHFNNFIAITQDGIGRITTETPPDIEGIITEGIDTCISVTIYNQNKTRISLIHFTRYSDQKGVAGELDFVRGKENENVFVEFTYRKKCEDDELKQLCKIFNNCQVKYNYHENPKMMITSYISRNDNKEAFHFLYCELNSNGELDTSKIHFGIDVYCSFKNGMSFLSHISASKKNQLVSLTIHYNGVVFCNNPTKTQVEQLRKGVNFSILKGCFPSKCDECYLNDIFEYVIPDPTEEKIKLLNEIGFTETIKKSDLIYVELPSKVLRNNVLKKLELERFSIQRPSSENLGKEMGEYNKYLTAELEGETLFFVIPKKEKKLKEVLTNRFGSNEDKYKAAEAAKEEGTKAFKDTDWNGAIRMYSTSLGHVEAMPDMGPEEIDNCNKMKLALYLNLAICYLKVDKFNEALDSSESALKLDPKNVKGLFRKGMALSGLKKFEEALIVFKQSEEIEHSTSTISWIKNTEAKLQVEKDKEKKLAQKMFGFN